MTDLLRLYHLKLACRWSLGFVWIWEGLVPKILWTADPRQLDLVKASGLFWPDPRTFLVLLGIAMIAAGTVLCLGWRERTTALVLSLAMTILIVLVAGTRPVLLADLDAGIAKDACLYAAAWVVWILAPLVPTHPARDAGAGDSPISTGATGRPEGRSRAT